MYIHVQPQQPCLAAAAGGWAADFIGRVERVDEDIALVLAELERRRPAAARPVPPLGANLQNVNGRGCNETAEGECRSAPCCGCALEGPLLAAGDDLSTPCPPPAGNRPAAREQYCDPSTYFSGPHVGCLTGVAQAFARDFAALQFPAPEAGTGADVADARRR